MNKQIKILKIENITEFISIFIIANFIFGLLYNFFYFTFLDIGLNSSFLGIQDILFAFLDGLAPMTAISFCILCYFYFYEYYETSLEKFKNKESFKKKLKEIEKIDKRLKTIDRSIIKKLTKLNKDFLKDSLFLFKCSLFSVLLKLHVILGDVDKPFYIKFKQKLLEAKIRVSGFKDLRKELKKELKKEREKNKKCKKIIIYSKKIIFKRYFKHFFILILLSSYLYILFPNAFTSNLVIVNGSALLFYVLYFLIYLNIFKNKYIFIHIEVMLLFYIGLSAKIDGLSFKKQRYIIALDNSQTMEGNLLRTMSNFVLMKQNEDFVFINKNEIVSVTKIKKSDKEKK